MSTSISPKPEPLSYRPRIPFAKGEGRVRTDRVLRGLHAENRQIPAMSISLLAMEAMMHLEAPSEKGFASTDSGVAKAFIQLDSHASPANWRASTATKIQPMLSDLTLRIFKKNPNHPCRASQTSLESKRTKEVH